jgi:S-adenosylmethionine hydrolase
MHFFHSVTTFLRTVIKYGNSSSDFMAGSMSIISLLSDFGQKDPYVAEMKAAILSINPQARIIDITHEIEKFSIRTGAYVLASAASYFPSNTVHVAVVDPGVGTKRRPIIAQTNRSIYVGPDNGLLMLAAYKEKIKNVYIIDNPQYMLSEVSKTFHGRDIFAPAAAHLTTGIKPPEFGPTIHDYVFPEYAKPHIKPRELVGEVLSIDDFGNIISNISTKDLEKSGFHEGDSFTVALGCKTLNLHFCSTYGEVPIGAPLALIGSSNFLEAAVNQGSASAAFKAKVGGTFCVSEV